MLPQAPDFSKPTHARFRSKLAQIVALAETGDIDALPAFEIKPVSSSPTERGAVVHAARQAREAFRDMRERLDLARETYGAEREAGQGRVSAGLAALRAAASKERGAGASDDIRERLARITGRDGLDGQGPDREEPQRGGRSGAADSSHGRGAIGCSASSEPIQRDSYQSRKGSYSLSYSYRFKASSATAKKKRKETAALTPS